MLQRRLGFVSIFALSALGFIHNGYSDSVSEMNAWTERSEDADVDVNEPSPEEIEAELELQRYLDPTLQRSELPQPDDSNKPFVQVDVFKTPIGVGVKKEFLVVSVDGMIHSVHVVSTATLKPVLNKATGKYENKKTIEKTHPLTYLKLKNQPWPWKTSTKYNNSPMYWGLNIKGGYYIHSTPHYYQLGTPASMGCVRVSFPTAMELFDLVVNVAEGNAKITIHAPGDAKKRMTELNLDAGYVNDRVEADLADALAVSKKDYNGKGHARIGQPLVWPKCQTVDCFDYFGVKKPPAPTPMPTPTPAPTASPFLPWIITR